MYLDDNNIDFILPWIDPSDKTWQKEKAYYERTSNTEDNASQTRFRDMHTLKYVLRSIEKHCPWYNKIYLISTGHYPKWLNLSHPKIDLITHEELFIDKSNLPVFNSHAIEMNLANIPQLSENFIYLNDDTLIWKELKRDRFFKNGKVVDFFHHGWIPRNKVFTFFKGKDTWVDALNNNLELLNNTVVPKQLSTEQLYHPSYGIKHKISNYLFQNVYKDLFWINHWHHPQPYKKETIQKVFEIYKDKMLEVSTHKFRSSSDITPYLYRYWHLLTGDFEPYFHNDGHVVKASSLADLEHSIEKIEENNTINFICFNDQAKNISDKEFIKLSEGLSLYLEEKFPHKASFEN